MNGSVLLGNGLRDFLVSTRFRKTESVRARLALRSIERAGGLQLCWLGCTALLCAQETRCDALGQ